MNRAFNFAAGPAILPLSVLERVRDELLDYRGTGMSIMEMSHRWEVFETLHNDSMSLLREIAAIPERFDILYMTGGASTQFALVPMNLSGSGRRAGYVNTGVWSKKAIDQAKIQELDVFIAGSSESEKFNHIPGKLENPGGLDYLHITTNNTIYGTQFHRLPDPGDTKLVIDMSSDFLSYPVDWKGIGLVYAGLQKNAGPSGLTAVLIDREYYQRESKKTPTMFRYSTHAESNSMYNTPPTFQIYVFYYVLQWIKEQGGLAAIEKRNREKAALLYQVLDEMPDYYRGHAKKDSRSLMNVTFTLPTPELELKFRKEAEDHRMMGLKGHRLVGGLRASIYNALPREACAALADFMRDFAKRNG